MTPVTLDLVRKDDQIISFAQSVLLFYSVFDKVKRNLASAAGIIGKFIIALFLVSILIFVTVPAVLLYGLLLVAMLTYVVTVFQINRNKTVEQLEELERKDLIDLHFKLKKALRKIEPLKQSDILFNTALIGKLMRKYVADLSFMEEELRKRAYPNHNKRPMNPTVHKHNPDDPWQSDLSDLRRVS